MHGWMPGQGEAVREFMAKILWSGSENKALQSFGWWLEGLVLRSLWWLVTPMSIDLASAGQAEPLAGNFSHAPVPVPWSLRRLDLRG